MNILLDVAARWGVDLTPDQLSQFQVYYEQLIAWNARMNLTAITDPEGVQIRHFADSMAVLLALDLNTLGPRTSLIDIGTGAGFPGLPLKIRQPAWHVTVVDATRKKITFLEHLISCLGLENVRAVWARAEGLGHEPAYREQFDLVVARAVADMAVLAEYALPFLRPGGRFIAQKGTNPTEEVLAAARAIEVLGGTYRDTVPYCLPARAEPRHLVVIEKVSPTPEKYPRRPGLPAKRPLG